MRPTSVPETSFWLMCSNAVSSLWPRSRQTCCLNAISPRAICDPNEGVKSSTNILPSVWAVGSGQCTCVPPPHRCSVDCAHKRGPLRFAPGAHFILIILFFGSSQFLVIASMNHNSCGSVYGFCGPRAGFASVHAGKKKKKVEKVAVKSVDCGHSCFCFLTLTLLKHSDYFPPTLCTSLFPPPSQYSHFFMHWNFSRGFHSKPRSTVRTVSFGFFTSPFPNEELNNYKFLSCFLSHLTFASSICRWRSADIGLSWSEPQSPVFNFRLDSRS